MGIHQLKDSAVQIEGFKDKNPGLSSIQQIKKFIQTCEQALGELSDELPSL